MNEHPTEPMRTPESPGSVRRHLSIVLASAILTVQLIPTGFDAPTQTPPAPLAAAVPVPAEIDVILRRSCYDCHGNTTTVPWYGLVQPVRGWMADHVREGRRELNFDEFGGYRPRRQLRKLEQIAGEVRSDGMPLPSYLIMHGDARLDDAQRTALYAWVTSSVEQLRSRIPPDTLASRR